MRVTPSVHIFECLGRSVGGIRKCGLFRGMSTGVGFKVSKVHGIRTLLVLIVWNYSHCLITFMMVSISTPQKS